MNTDAVRIKERKWNTKEGMKEKEKRRQEVVDVS